MIKDISKYQALPESTKEARKTASRKYADRMTKQVNLALNRSTDADIIAALERCGNVQGYIKALIRRDMQQEPRRCRTCRYFGWNRDSDESCDYWDGCATEPEGFCHKWAHK